MKWNGLLHEKLFSEASTEYTSKLDPIEPKSFLFSYYNYQFIRNVKSKIISLL